MTKICLGGSDPTTLLSHLATYGLASVLAEATGSAVTVSWTVGMNPRPEIHAPGLLETEVARAIRAHAHTAETWVTATFPDRNGTPRGLMSPRRAIDTTRLRDLQQARWDTIDSLPTPLHRRLASAIGEPAHWCAQIKDNSVTPTPDDGASRYEMTPRNNGSEVMGSRFAKMARPIQDRSDQQILAGLAGTAMLDSLDSGPNSRSATGMAEPGPVDTALAWCALWGINCLPVIPRTQQPNPRHRGQPSATAANIANIRTPKDEYFALPAWNAPWTIAKVRTILAGAHLTAGATQLLTGSHAPTPEITWLRERGVTALVTFEVGSRGGGGRNAKERYANRGRVHTLGM